MENSPMLARSWTPCRYSALSVLQMEARYDGANGHKTGHHGMMALCKNEYHNVNKHSLSRAIPWQFSCSVLIAGLQTHKSTNDYCTTPPPASFWTRKAISLTINSYQEHLKLVHVVEFGAKSHSNATWLVSSYSRSKKLALYTAMTA
jgi:hypothetical protein